MYICRWPWNLPSIVLNVSALNCSGVFASLVIGVKRSRNILFSMVSHGGNTGFFLLSGRLGLYGRHQLFIVSCIFNVNGLRALQLKSFCGFSLTWYMHSYNGWFLGLVMIL